jgi:hypothetical protein
MKEDLPKKNLRDLAEEVMDDKREDGNSEDRTRELYDVPTLSPSSLASHGDDQGDVS